MINSDLVLRGLTVSGSLSVRRDKLRNLLLIEREYDIMKSVIDGRNKMDIERLPYISVEQAIVCILHLENRVSETILKKLMTEGIESLISDSNESEMEVITKFEDVLNNVIWGNEVKPSQWKVPVDSNKNTIIGAFMINNGMARRLVDKFDSLLSVIQMNDDKKQQWTKCVKYFKDMVLILRQKEDFTDERIEEFQVLADKFFHTWITLHGTQGVTNYIHMIGSGHISYYLKHWRNLYRYSQQGWEALNNVIKLVFHRRTQKGGSQGCSKLSSSKVKGIGMWLQRLILWRAGFNFDV